MIKTELTSDDRKKRIATLREHHQPLFNKLNVPDAIFTCKMAWKPSSFNEKVCSFFPSELNKKQDIYVEFTDRDYTPHSDRFLYKLPYNPHYQEEYTLINKDDPTKNESYYIPISSFIKVERQVESSIPTDFDITSEIIDPDADCPLDQMTVRDLFAIIRNIPVSRKEWLNSLIKTNNGITP